jgi:hypothetical protein
MWHPRLMVDFHHEQIGTMMAEKGVGALGGFTWKAPR